MEGDHCDRDSQEDPALISELYPAGYSSYMPLLPRLTTSANGSAIKYYVLSYYGIL